MQKLGYKKAKYLENVIFIYPKPRYHCRTNKVSLSCCPFGPAQSKEVCPFVPWDKKIPQLIPQLLPKLISRQESYQTVLH